MREIVVPVGLGGRLRRIRNDFFVVGARRKVGEGFDEPILPLTSHRRQVAGQPAVGRRDEDDGDAPVLRRLVVADVLGRVRTTADSRSNASCR